MRSIGRLLVFAIAVVIAIIVGVIVISALALGWYFYQWFIV